MNSEPLVAISTDSSLLVEPIWEKPIDDFEGPLYQEYIKQNPGYDKVVVRQRVAKMLNSASECLDDNYLMILRAGHRPIEVQYKLLEMVKANYQTENPTASEEAALEFARIYVADPSVKEPPHCCGAAVDIDALDKRTGQLVDFGCSINTDSDIAALDTDKINDAQRANRNILHSAMLAAGFAPHPKEWWHFSYGDTLWADFYNKPGAFYGLIEP